MKIKRLFAAVSAVTMVATCSLSNVSAEDSEEDYMMGCISETQEEIENFFGEPVTYTQEETTFESRVDLSQDPCFPEIEDQGDYLGSCVAFATTYYQFTYEVNKLNGVTNKEDIVVYSPKWTYNLSNNSMNSGSEITDAYKVLIDLGALKNEDFPYVAEAGDYIGIPSEMINEKIEALSTRVVDKHCYEIPNNANISSPNSSALNGIKKALSDGKVLVSETECDFNSVYENGRCIAYRCFDSKLPNDSTHAVAIVGYDDTISYDVNGNGTIEDCEKGALKVANSWGKKYEQNGIVSNDNGNKEEDGYFWVLYDSLNLTSANTVNNWESGLSGTRYPTFSISNKTSGVNNFYSIDVAHKDVTLVGELYIDTPDREALTIMAGRTTDNITSWQGNEDNEDDVIANCLGEYIDKIYFPNIPIDNYDIAYEGYLIFDYSLLANPISQYITGYNWHVNINQIQANSIDSAKLRLLDSKGTAITDYSDLTQVNNTFSAYKNVSLQRGDVDYDGSVTVADSSLIMNYVSMSTTFSALQIELGDYNNDGETNTSDVIALNNSLLSKATASERIVINTLNNRARTYMLTCELGGNVNETY